MNAGAAARQDDHRSTEQLRANLIRLCSLSAEVVSKISEVQRMTDSGFGEAALQLGFVTREDIDDALSWGSKIAQIERAKLRPGRQLLIIHFPDHPRSETMRALRTELLLRQEPDGRANVLVALSPGAGEGRSQLAAELAVAFAQLGQPTLLVDADLRRPRQHELFCADNARGLSNAIENWETPFYHPVEGVPKLSVLTAGPIPGNPLELLSDQRFEILLDSWRSEYRHIVFDTPPVSTFADGLAVATVARRVLLLSRAASTATRDTRNMLRRLAPTRARVLGAVLNRF